MANDEKMSKKTFSLSRQQKNVFICFECISMCLHLYMSVIFFVSLQFELNSLRFNPENKLN